MPDTGRYSCPRCGAGLGDSDSYGAHDISADAGALPDAAAADAPPAYDAWELEQQLRHIERLLRIDRPDRGEETPGAPLQWARVDAPHVGPLGWHHPEAAHTKAARRRAAEARRTRSWSPVLTWSVLAVGLMASVFGGVLLVWATVAERSELWTLGMPVGLGGQIVLVIGLILQLDRLWNDSRHTAEKLQHVDDRLVDLDRATFLLGGGPGAAARSRSPHPTGGVTAQMLLADLKTRLDLLAVKLAQEEW